MKTATLITGASSGIGLELARIFATNRHNLILVARNEESLRQLKKQLKEQHHIQVAVIVKDLSEPGTAEDIFRTTKEQNWNVEVLVNNAGFGLAGYFCEADLPTEIDMIMVNVSAVVELTKLFLKDMLERGKGKILNVGSTASFVPGPGLAVYYATKAFVLSFSQAVGYEVKKRGVTVSTLCPGPTATNFSQRTNNHRSWAFNNGLIRLMSAEKVARITFKQFMQGRSLIVPGAMNKLSVFFPRLMPRKLLLFFIHFINKDRS